MVKKFESFWSPIVWVDNMKTAVKSIAVYSSALSIVLITLIVYQMLGGESTQLYNPLFEFDVRNSLQYLGSFFILFLVTLIVNSCLMIFGVNRGVRGYILPWLVMWGIVCSFQLLFGIWLLWAYYIYLDVVFIVLCDYLWMGYNIYCGLVIYSIVQLLKELQSPNIELLWT